MFSLEYKYFVSDQKLNESMAVDYINNLCKSSGWNKLGRGETNKKNQRFGKSGATQKNTNQQLGKSGGMKNN